MYARRNSLTLLLLLLVIGGFGFFWQRREAQALAALNQKAQELRQRFSGEMEVAQTLNLAMATRDSLQRLWQNSAKKLIAAEEPAFSLSYINWLIQVHNLNIDFDFYLNEKKPAAEYTAFSYTLNGEGPYRDIFALLWYMTHNPLLYQIKSVNFGRSEQEPRLLRFNLMFEGYSMNKDWEIGSELTLASPQLDWNTEFAFDAFNSLVPLSAKARTVVTEAVSAPAPVPADEAPELLDVERATLLAITNNKAYLRGADGKIFPLVVGDAVRRGRLTQIDIGRNQVEFEVRSETGMRTLRLNIEYN
ncbi:MAG: hypothetical protein ONB48_09300 [candidate division KSB1 bacterium]|nr:hypothetical protein [candidate division KSB1 bacterium]MDZ7273683.1 hypothetical protein [candidate division KSB1 bacterium]MDZ7285839.1 hypothetical protein [candidate division KSB1 bacterium]MDZ7298871.1 hypothetical protein [candidate division KSB1 bacterium]MDZ7307083.1 hypothetical protein [candidate division KSB1 bacterium]